MSTKNISRSALEGGRVTGNKQDRNASHRHERSRFREWIGRVMIDHDEFDHSFAEPREKVVKEFTDKLNPCWRWLESKVGERWDDVYSELTKKFDTRNLSSWHIVNQHMIAEVRGAGTPSDGIESWRRQRFIIDKDGFLRKSGNEYHKHRFHPEGPTRAEVFAKVAGRAIVDHGAVQFWGDPSPGKWLPCHLDSKHCFLNQHKMIEGRWSHLAPYGWRQGKRFTKEESQWWETISESIKKYIVVDVSGR